MSPNDNRLYSPPEVDAWVIVSQAPVRVPSLLAKEMLGDDSDYDDEPEGSEASCSDSECEDEPTDDDDSSKMSRDVISDGFGLSHSMSFDTMFTSAFVVVNTSPLVTQGYPCSPSLCSLPWSFRSWLRSILRVQTSNHLSPPRVSETDWSFMVT